MTQPDEQFSLGVTYWPRGAGYAMWRAYDRGAIREELAHIVTLGCDTVRLCLLWEDFQPGPERLEGAAMRHLEHALDTAHAAGLRAVPVLFPVAVGGALHIPYWANGPDVAGAIRRGGRGGGMVVMRPPGLGTVLTGAGYRPTQAGDLFDDPTAVEAQRYLVREVVGYFGAHPAAWAWQIGEGLERVRRPESHAAARRWLSGTADEVRRQRAGARVLGVTSAPALEQRAGPRPDDIAELCDIVGVAADPQELPPENQRRHTSYPAFLHALTAGLAGRRAIVTSLGVPSALPGVSGWVEDECYGRPLRAFFSDGGGQAAFVEAALDRLYRDGAAGAWLAGYADFPEEQWRLPPLDRALRQRAMGVVDAAGREKPAAEALRSFAQSLRRAEGRQPHPAPAAVDAERYWRDPRARLHELWQEFNLPRE